MKSIRTIAEIKEAGCYRMSMVDRNLARFFVHSDGDVENTVPRTLGTMMVRRKTVPSGITRKLQ